MTIFLHFNFDLVLHFMYFFMTKYCLLSDIDTQYSIFLLFITLSVTEFPFT